MEFTLFQSYQSEELLQSGMVAPNPVRTRFCTNFEETAHALFLMLDNSPSWCHPPTDQNRCFFFTPSRLRLGIHCCENQEQLLAFHADRSPLPRQHRRIHLFAWLTLDEWCYLGEPELGSCYLTDGVIRQFEFGLDEKLPEEIWIRLGGYRGWLVCIGREQHVLQVASDADNLLANRWRAESPFLTVTRYKGDALFAVTDASNTAVITYGDGVRELHSLGADSYDDEDFVAFHEFEYPRGWLISRWEAIKLIRRYLETGVPNGLIE
jgi:hypothetical protein